MGGRGSAGGVSLNGIKYGTEYHSLLEVGNIKFIQRNEGSQNSPLETMSAAKNRIYVVIRPDDKIKSVTFYDKDGKRTREIHLDHYHSGVLPHAHNGYYHSPETAPLTAYDKRIINKVKSLWGEYNNGK